MRDPKRIDEFLERLGTIWKEECPDWRFGQLIVNVFEANQRSTILFSEEDNMIEVFEAYFGRSEPSERNEHLYFGRKEPRVRTLACVSSGVRT